MISKSVSLVIALLTLVGLAAPTGVMLQLQTARAQIGDGDNDIANIVDDALNTAFSAVGIGGEEEEEDDEEETATEEEEAAAAEAEDQSGDDNQDIDQTQDQRNEQDQDAEQEVDQENDQSETNIQANELDTGDNTATIAQSNDADEDDDEDGGQDVAAAAEASDEEEDSDSTDADAAAEAIGIVDQSNTATVRQNSSINNVDLSNNVAFGDDTNTQIAVPIIDQDQRAANLAEQRAANLDHEIVRVQQPTPTSTTQPPEEEQPEEGNSFCFINSADALRCFPTPNECERALAEETNPKTPCVLVGPN